MTFNYCNTGCSCDSTGKDYIPCKKCGESNCPDSLNEEYLCGKCEDWEVVET